MTDASTPTPRRALVLGGGGVAGIAWHLGVIVELLDKGVDIDRADLVVGTSAGSVAGSVLRFGQAAAVLAAQVTSEMPELSAADAAQAADPEAAAASGAPGIDMATFRDRLVEAISGATGEQDARARLGAAAIEFGSSASGSLVGTMEEQFPPAYGWPAAPLGVCVVDAESGEFRVFDSSDGVPLSQAVAASCSVPLVFPPVEIDGRSYVDGGARSATNADVASGYDKILVLSCGPEDPASPLGPQLDQAVAALRAEGSDVLVVSADEASLLAFGGNSLAPSTRVPSALAGQAQAAGALDRIRAFWA
jgi:NTE family protein